ncbi:transcriptional regulator [Thiovulum sp. ES]|nr:transcriptional regulator [Thiovulum sp. ES]
MYYDIKYLLLEKFNIVEKLSLSEAEADGIKYRNMVTGTRIYTLLKYDGDYSISELSKELGVSRQTIHKSVHILKEDGFVKLVNSEKNRKVKIVKLTPFGIEMLEKREKIINRVEEKIEKELGKEDFLLLKKTLSKDWKI